MNYRDFLPELKTMPLFQNIGEDELIALLEVMAPEIVCLKPDDKSIPVDMKAGMFCLVLRGTPIEGLQPRLNVYDMPKIFEPGMMMGEIPCLSERIKSKAPDAGRGRGGHGPPPQRNYDLYLLRMSGEMVTKFYGAEFSGGAQGRMLRNFLGILAQKVTDVRREKTELAIEAAKQLAPYRLNVFCAGVSMRLVGETAERWNASHPELPVVVTPGGSVDLVRACIATEPCDLLVSADDAIIRTMMMPEYTDGYRIWAGNSMVIAGEGINSENWEQKLFEEGATFKHHDPYGDPGGYRAVMSLLLADEYKPGLSARLMNHPGHIGMEKNSGPAGRMRTARYEITYYSAAKKSGGDFAELPAVMNLSDDSLSSIYAKASFAVDENNTVTATPIAHAITIPKTALHKQAAQEFARMFLAIDKQAEGFISREGVFGLDPLQSDFTGKPH